MNRLLKTIVLLALGLLLVSLGAVGGISLDRAGMLPASSTAAQSEQDPADTPASQTTQDPADTPASQTTQDPADTPAPQATHVTQTAHDTPETPATPNTQNEQDAVGIDTALIQEALRVIEQHYVVDSAVEEEALTDGAIRGMVEALGDPGHSRYLTQGELQAHQQNIRGEFEGIGVEVISRDGALVIVAPIDGTPAQRAGLKPGELILAVDGASLETLTLEQAIQHILGPAGTRVSLTIMNPETTQSREVEIVRARIELDAVTWAQVPGSSIAHLRLASFSAGSAAEIEQALEEIKAAGLTGVIFDLRNNPGGLVVEAIGITSHFLTEGNVLLVKDAAGNVNEVPVKPGASAPDIPLVVLINQGTASSAEIVTGALQDYERAQAVGVKTFGTGTVLNQFALSDGSALLLATQLWLTPDGRQIWQQGLEPDILVEMPIEVAPLTPPALQELAPEEVSQIEDLQLLRALDLLRK